MGTRVPASPDRTLSFKRALFGSLYRAARSPWMQGVFARGMAPDHPALALAQGESLVQTPRRVLALTAHPDDLEFFAGGTLRRMADAGSHIFAVVMSDGEKRGNWADLGGQRRTEQEAAARFQGYHSVTFMGLPDFGLPEDPRLEPVVARAWDEVAPEVVFAFDPKELLPQTANRDHKALGRTVMDLARAKLNTGVQVYFYGTQHPDVLVDIGGVMEAKLRAVKAHQSQMVFLNEAETDGTIRLMARIAASSAPCAFAEPLYRLC
ncbi:MAG TPA: PIG-L deacetylase family protein [Symbiobacteriaceae bacterium]|nr:PIG-L deacetylase family protein [Symbiobacteriaceae bacterium]